MSDSVKAEPAVSFEFIEEWFERSATKAEQQGKRESAMLWRDGLAHLRSAHARAERLEAALREWAEFDFAMNAMHTVRELQERTASLLGDAKAA